MEKYGIERWYTEKISGKDANRPKLQEMLEYVREGDTAHIHDLSRLARSTADLLVIVDLLGKKGVTYKSPHKARYGHIHLGMSKARTAEERKAISENAMHGSLSVTDEVYARMNSDQANKILASFDFDDNPSGKHPDPEIESNANSDSMNDMMMKLFTAMDPDMLIRAGEFMKSMKTNF